jgi:hypothetical protein
VVWRVVVSMESPFARKGVVAALPVELLSSHAFRTLSDDAGAPVVRIVLVPSLDDFFAIFRKLLDLGFDFLRRKVPAVP